MSREIKLGILTLVTIAVCIWGYKFLLGKNIFGSSNTFFIEYDNIDQLAVSDPVTISGYQVGTVQSISLKPEDLRTVLVSIDVKSNIKLPQNTVAELRSDGVMGGKSIVLNYTGICDSDCLTDGSFLQGAQFGLIQSMVSPKEIGDYVEVIRDGVTGVVDSLNNQLGPEGSGEVAETARSFAQTIKNLEEATAQMSYLFRASSSKLVSLVDNLDAVTGEIRQNSTQISSMINDLSAITEQLRSAGLDSTVLLANDAIASSGAAIAQMDATLQKAESSFASLQNMLDGINQGEGTLGSLAQDKELYTNLSNATKELELLLEDFRMHPKRYIRGIFGKKRIPYEAPAKTPIPAASSSVPDSTN